MEVQCIARQRCRCRERLASTPRFRQKKQVSDEPLFRRYDTLPGLPGQPDVEDVRKRLAGQNREPCEIVLLNVWSLSKRRQS